jgi:hypothetical protein
MVDYAEVEMVDPESSEKKMFFHLTMRGADQAVS